MNIGVIGLGTVGRAVYSVLMKHHQVRGYDKNRKSDPFEDMLNCDVVFICVPTPGGIDGRLSDTEIKKVLKRLESPKPRTGSGVARGPYDGVVAIKSTLPLGFFRDLKTPLRIVYNPEFLHWTRAWEDFEDPWFVVLAGTSLNVAVVKDVYGWVDPRRFEVVSYGEAEMIKLVMNAFATTKISFWNEIRILCEENDVNVARIRDILRKDVDRWTDEYTDPMKGPYGGACLPKDTRELMHASDWIVLLKAVEEANERMKRYLKKT